MANKDRKFSRRTLALLWTVLVAVVIGVLIYFEQISVLYVRATHSIVALLVFFAFADLEKIGFDSGE